MTGFVYPRLLASYAESSAGEIMRRYRKGGVEGVREVAQYSHPQASPVPTGGRVADEARIARVRESVVEATEPWLTQASVDKKTASAFDIALGRSLHSALEIIPSDAAHQETWNFLSVVVMPDVVATRLPEPRAAQFLGNMRNPLRSAWIRRDTLGDLLDREDNQLGVDEMVGLFERQEMARNRPLVRALARAVMDYEGDRARSEWARALFKEVRYMTGPLILDGMTEEELTELISEIARTRVLQ